MAQYMRGEARRAAWQERGRDCRGGVRRQETKL